MTGDASGRRYFRGPDGVLVCYPPDMVEVLDHFLYWQHKYRTVGLPVPDVIRVDRQDRTVLLEDLGDCHGSDYLAGLDRGAAVSFVSTVHEWTKKIHAMTDGVCEHRLPPVPIADELAFLLQHGKGWVLDDHALAWMPRLCHAIVDRLNGMPVELAHRDFHLRNVLVRDGKGYLIDFQDTRLAPVHYDRVSLLFDNYADLAGIRRQVWEDLDNPDLRWVALQRSLKALGTFCFLCFVVGKQWFRPSIPVAVRHVSDHLASLGLRREEREWERVRERVAYLYSG